MFTGKEQDSETGHYYFGARYYHPALGRWMAVDPLAGDYPSLSPYVYAANNPIVFIDLDGNKIVLGSTIDRVANFFGYKTENLKRLEGITTALKNTETGSKLYNQLDARSETITIVIKNDLKNPSGQKLNGITEVTAVENDHVSEVTVTIDPNSANSDARNTKMVGDQGAATTLAHELGHAKSAVTNLRQYMKEATPKGKRTVFGDKGTGNAEQAQAKPSENAVRKELLNKKKEKQNDR